MDLETLPPIFLTTFAPAFHDAFAIRTVAIPPVISAGRASTVKLPHSSALMCARYSGNWLITWQDYPYASPPDHAAADIVKGLSVSYALSPLICGRNRHLKIFCVSLLKHSCALEAIDAQLRDPITLPARDELLHSISPLSPREFIPIIMDWNWQIDHHFWYSKCPLPDRMMNSPYEKPGMVEAL